MECPKCDKKIMSIYVRCGKVFDSLEDRKYCPHCDTIFKIKVIQENEFVLHTEEKK